MSKVALVFLIAAVMLVAGCVSQSNSNPDVPDLPQYPTDEQVEDQQNTIESRAVTGTEINLRGCDPEPEVLRVAESAKIKITNPDNDQHRISIASQSYRINEGTFFELIAKFPQGKGTYNYNCDDIQNAGYIIIE